MKEGKKWIRRLLLVLGGILILLHLVPYFIPVSAEDHRAPLPFAQSGRVEVEGVSLHYRVWTPEVVGPDAQQVLFVHGLGGSTFSWRHQVEDLVQADHVVMAVDLPGFGYSSRLRGLDHSQVNRAGMLWQLMDQVEEIQLLRPVHLVGHSMGAGTISAMAVQQPERTASLVYVCGAVLSGGSRRGFLTRYPPAARWLQVVLHHVLLTESRIEGFLASAYGRKPEPEEVRGYLAPLLMPGTAGALVDTVNTSTRTPVETLEQIDELGIPVRMIWGRNDTWVPVEDGLRLEEMLGKSRLDVIEEAAHCPMETHAQIFNRLLLEHLNEVRDWSGG